MNGRLYNLISGSHSFVIYGAQMVAYGAFVAIKHLLGRVPDCFIVSDTEGNPLEIDSIPVVSLADYLEGSSSDSSVSKDTLILVAATEIFQNEISAMLNVAGLSKHFLISAREEHLLMSEYFSKIGMFPLAEKNVANEDGTIGLSLFLVQSHVDKPLKISPSLELWEVPIQAGADLTDLRLCKLIDNSGDNISNKNKQYCEASAMYWVWKNSPNDWIGIEHYRRRLLVSPDMLCNDVDVIITLPYMCYPSVLSHHKRFVGDDVVDAMLVALKALHPSEYEHYIDCLNGTFHFAYNLFAASFDVYSTYCEWVFGITQYIERLGFPDILDTRALSYVVELLTSVYFTANLGNLSIRHVEKAIYA